MSRGRRIVLIVLAIVLPVALTLGAYLISAGVGASAGVVSVPAGGAIVSLEPSTGPSPSDDRGAHPTSGVSPSDDHSGKCLEPEHVNDPTCTSGSGGSGSSGSGGSGSSGSGGGDD